MYYNVVYSAIIFCATLWHNDVEKIKTKVKKKMFKIAIGKNEN